MYKHIDGVKITDDIIQVGGGREKPLIDAYIYDFVDAYQRFLDPEWDGEPQPVELCVVCGESPCICEKAPLKPCSVCGQRPCVCEKEPPESCEKCGQSPCVCTRRVKIKLSDGKEREIQHMTSTSF